MAQQILNKRGNGIEISYPSAYGGKTGKEYVVPFVEKERAYRVTFRQGAGKLAVVYVSATSVAEALDKGADYCIEEGINFVHGTKEQMLAYDEVGENQPVREVGTKTKVWIPVSGSSAIIQSDETAANYNKIFRAAE